MELRDRAPEPARRGGRSVHGRFELIARTSPDAVALSAVDARLTYAELDVAAEQLADRLRSSGVRRGDRVGISLDRSAELIIAMLGILKTGAAYVVIDPGDPAARVASVIEDAGIAVVLTEQPSVGAPGTRAAVMSVGARDAPPGGTLTAPSPAATGPGPGPSAGPTDLAYVAYTSGSTGRPKGVCVPHRAISRLVVGTDFLDIGPQDVFLQYAPAAFDASTLEIWGALLNGACLVLAPAGRLGPAELLALVRDAGVSVLWLTAGVFHQVVDAGLPALPRLRYLIAGGDVLSAAHVDRAAAALADCVLMNGYGPTENTTFTCCYPVSGRIGERPVPIGLPIRGTSVYLLDERLTPVSDGAVGRLYAAGSGLAHGYAGRPALTAERFVPDPFSDTPGERMYDTGDLVRRGADGQIEFVGRADAQVKIRGFRVEPGEIESRLRSRPDIDDAVVVVQPDSAGERRLAAFYVGAAGPSSGELRRFLAAAVPGYMVPATIVRLDALPLTANGKVDRSLLAGHRSRARPEIDSDFRQPAGDMEAWLAELWQDVIGVEPIGADDDFFELGGHSLMATRITAEIAARFDVVIKARVFYLNPTVAELAGRLDELVAHRREKG